MADREILPDTFRPVNYDIVLTDLDFSAWSYKGSVKIHGELIKSASEITLNTLELKLISATLWAGSHTAQDSSFANDVTTQRSTITFKDAVPASKEAVLSVEFTGTINQDMAGFYRSQYKPAVLAVASVPRDDEFHYMLSTQFEACDARRAFPCFDEPALKATYDFAIEIPDDLVALSNMPEKSTEPAGPGRKLVTFERTPVMSTYLVAWAVGDFEYIEAFTERKYEGRQLPVRLYTTRGLTDQGQWALEHAPKIIDFFSEAFELDYPLPKADILAVHEFTHGAMENWGLVTYRLTAILFDEKLSDARFKERIAYVVSHELAHSWFGNWTTVAWFDELWLNEGFATWAGYLALEHLHPEWNNWAVVVRDITEAAFKLDSLRASHPIHVELRNALDVNQVFDAISYRKGCSVIRMLADHLGHKTFLKGVSNYLRQHAYGSATTLELWEALSEVSGLDVGALMDAWVTKIGFPVLTVAEEPGQIFIRQSRFLSTGDVTAQDDTTTWWVPLYMEGKNAVEGVAKLSLTSREETIRDVSDDFYKVNSDAVGFYRVSYPPARLAKLGTQLGRLSLIDKTYIIGSAAALAFSGHGTTAALLSFLQGFSAETDYIVFSQALDSLAQVKSVFGGDEAINAGLKKFTLRLVDNAVAELGWDFPADEDLRKSQLRKRVLVAAAVNGHPGVVEEALRRFRAYKSDPTAHPLNPNLRTPVFRAALAADPAETVDFLKAEWFSTPAVDGQEICLSVMGHVQDRAVIESTVLPFVFAQSPPAPASEAVPPGDIHYIAAALSANRMARDLQWAWVRGRWADVESKLGGNPIVLDRLVLVTLRNFVDLDTCAEIEDFYRDKDTRSFNRTLGTVLDQIRGRAAYRLRDAAALGEWLAANGY